MVLLMPLQLVLLPLQLVLLPLQLVLLPLQLVLLPARLQHKTSEELEIMRYANKVAGAAHVEMMQAAQAGMMEYQLESVFMSRWGGTGWLAGWPAGWLARTAAAACHDLT